MSSPPLVATKHRTREEALDIRTILQGLSCNHRRMRAAPCKECRESGRFCQILSCPDCGLTWDNSEDTHG